MPCTAAKPTPFGPLPKEVSVMVSSLSVVLVTLSPLSAALVRNTW